MGSTHPQAADFTDDSSRGRILSAALTEFATRGYEAASTNAIAASAGVAKGLIFHHFGSKERLLAAVFEREVRRFLERVFDEPEPLPRDLFERLHRLTVRRLTLALEEPRTAELLEIAVTEAPAETRAALAELQASVTRALWPKVLEGVDTKPLRRGVSLGDAVETVSLLTEGLERQLTALMRTHALDRAALSARVWRHLERLRDGLYR